MTSEGTRVRIPTRVVSMKESGVDKGKAGLGVSSAASYEEPWSTEARARSSARSSEGAVRSWPPREKRRSTCPRGRSDPAPRGAGDTRPRGVRIVGVGGRELHADQEDRYAALGR